MARSINVSFSADSSKLTSALDDVEKKTKSFGDKLGAAGKKMTVGFTLPIIAGLGAATKSAVEDAAAQAHLAQVLETTAGAGAKVVKGVEDQLSAFMKVSTYTDDEMRPAFEALVSVSGDVGYATDDLALAMDIAAHKGISLEDAANALAKAQGGNLGALNKLIPGIVDVTDKSLSYEDAMKALSATVGGAAVAATETAAGKTAMLKRDLGEMAEEIGAKALPMIEKLVGVAGDLLGKFVELPAPVQNIGLALVGVAAVSGPIMTAVASFGKLKAAIIATTHAGDAFLLRIAPIVAGAGLVKEYVEADEKGVGLGRGHTPVGIIKNLVQMLPGLAAGGPVTAGQSYVVGERGPEVFTPSTAGVVSPNGGGGGGGTTEVRVFLDGREIHQSLLRLQRQSGSLGFT